MQVASTAIYNTPEFPGGCSQERRAGLARRAGSTASFYPSHKTAPKNTKTKMH